MTAKRDSKSKPKKERPKIKKENLKDLDPENETGVKGGVPGSTGQLTCADGGPCGPSNASPCQPRR